MKNNRQMTVLFFADGDMNGLVIIALITRLTEYPCCVLVYSYCCVFMFQCFFDLFECPFFIFCRFFPDANSDRREIYDEKTDRWGFVEDLKNHKRESSDVDTTVDDLMHSLQGNSLIRFFLQISNN